MRVDRASGLTDAHHFSAAFGSKFTSLDLSESKTLDSNPFVFYMQTGDASLFRIRRPIESGTRSSRVSDYGRKARASDYHRGGVGLGLGFAFGFAFPTPVFSLLFELSFTFTFEFMFPRPRLRRPWREAAGVAGSAEFASV
jgi:hypothetical protein